MTETAAELAAFIGSRPAGPDGFGDEVKRRVARFAREKRETGSTWAAIAAGLPLSHASVRKWTMTYDDAPHRGDGFVEVHVATDRKVPSLPRVAARELTLVSPNGFRLIGLDVATAAALVAKLG